jgi:hypothetical protein
VRKILLAVFLPTQFTELVRVARLLKCSGQFAPTIWFAWPYKEVARDRQVCEAEEIPYIEDRTGSALGVEADLSPASSTPVSSRPAPQRAWSWLRGILVSLPFPVPLMRAVFRLTQHVFLARKVMARQEPACLMLAADDFDTAPLIKAAHGRGVPAVVVPFSLANALEPAETLFRDPAYGLASRANRVAATLYPRWVYEHRGHKMVRLPASQLFATEWWGLGAPLPWQYNSGAADALAVESAFMKSYYLREGIPGEKLMVTGALADDVLADSRRDASARRAELYTELGFPQDRRMILCALPDDRFALSGSQTEFRSYLEAIEFVMKTLVALPGCNVVVRLHPRVNYEAHRFVEQWGARITQRDTASLVPLCDLYVTSVSATIRWALACGIPVINYDFYRLRFTDYADAPGVIAVEDRTTFAAASHRLIDDSAFFADVQARQQADASRWGRLDGQSGARLLDFLNTIIERPRGRADA